MLNNVFLFAFTSPCCFVKLVIDVVALPSCILKYKNYHFQAPQCATLNAILENNLALRKFTYLDKKKTLLIKIGRDASKTLGI